MEQIDRMSLVSELFWITIFFLFLYFLVIGRLLPIIYTSLKLKHYLNFFYIKKAKKLTRNFCFLYTMNILVIKKNLFNWKFTLNILKKIKFNKADEI